MPDPVTPSESSIGAGPDYDQLVKFFIGPFLDSPESLRVDCEFLPSKDRVLIRVAFEGEDKGRVFGRGGRNIQAIRTVVEAAARLHGQFAHLDIYGGEPSERQANGAEEKSAAKPHPRRPSKLHS